MPKRAKKPGLREYLDQSGVLVNGSEQEIQAARRAYRKLYKTEHKRKQRQENREVGVLLPRAKEFNRIAAAAKKHKASIPAFLKMATLGYLNKTFLVPDRDLVARLAQMLSDCLNEVQQITQAKGRHSFLIEEKCEAIEKRIEQLEAQMTRAFSEPPDIEAAVRLAIGKDPDLRLRLLLLLTSVPNTPHV